MKKKLLILFVAVFVLSILAGCQSDSQESSGLKVAVSIVPQKAFVEAVAGDLAEVVVMIPPGASPANYQPTPKELTDLSESDVYFAIGVPTESVNIVPNMVEGAELPIVYLNDYVDEAYDARYFGADEHSHDHDEDEHDHDEEEHDHDEDEHDHDEDEHDHDEDEHDHDEDEHDEDEHDHDEDEHDEDEHDHDEEEHDHDEDDHDHSGRDPHIWLSPKRVIIMVEQIRDYLIELDGDNASVYEANAASFIESLESLDQDISEQLSEYQDLKFIMMHPSLGYLADDYGLHMESIEVDGKEATAQGLQEVIDFALEEDIHVIFYQSEFDYSQAETIAEAIDGQVVEVNVLSEDYINNMKLMVDVLIGAN